MEERKDKADTGLSVDFDEITKLFTNLKPAVAKVSSVREFVAIIQLVTEKICIKYFESPNSTAYKLEDLESIIPHVLNCINNITPDQIPYESVSINGRWTLRYKDRSNSRKSKSD